MNLKEGELGLPESPTPSGTSDEPSAPVNFAVRANLPFPVVGIGASAGGVEALREFFAATPPESGMAFIVIQHLAPDHQSFMEEILGRCTPMPVRQISDGMSVEPNHVYVIRPGHTVTLERGHLRLGEPVEKRGHRRPVDDFFRSLAREQQESALAVVLSGTGTNGSAGAQAIKAAGGLCIAQDPDKAEFPGMPQSLIHAGYADQVLNIAEIPAALLRYVQHPYIEPNATGRARAAQVLERHRQQLDEIIAALRRGTGHDFAPYKPATVLRRIQRRMGLAGVTDLEAYGARLSNIPAELTALANDLMINVTGFFRDPGAWEALRTSVIRPLVEDRESDSIRAWVSACASGEEPYTLAMLIAEEAQRAGRQLDVKIFATDTADKSLALARAGVYPGGIEGDLSAERLDLFFEKDEHTYRIKKALREQMVFAPHDILRDPPFSQVDIVTCRNLLIYLEPEAQRRALALLHFALREGGHLLLGNAETLGHAESLFEIVSKRWRIYRRTGPAQHRFAVLPTLTQRDSKLAPVVHRSSAIGGRPPVPVQIQVALLDEFVPPTAVVDANERLVYFQGDAAPYLLHPSGEITQNLLEMVRVPLRAAARSALRQSIAGKRAITLETDSQDNAGTRIAITAAPLRSRKAAQQFRVSFRPIATESASGAGSMEATPPLRRVEHVQGDEILAEELRLLQRELQTTVEAFESTNEELKASNEEVLSVNEELQSTNEELETGKEELQSLNEELITVNTQLQTKVMELESLTNDLDNLLSSTDIAVVFLDTQLNVRRYTPAVIDLLGLMPGDIGRPLVDLAQKFSGGDLIADAERVLSKLASLEAEVESHSGRWYLRRALPYRTEDNRIAGVVITFVDISGRKRSEQAIAEAQRRLNAVVEEMPAAVMIADAPSGKLYLANRQAAGLFNQPFPLPFIGHSWAAAFAALPGYHPNGLLYQLQEWPLARALATGATVLDEELDFVRADGSRGTVSMSAAPIRDSAGETVAAVAAFWDITERKRADRALRESEERFRTLVESADEYAIFMLDPQGLVVSWNRGAERVTGFTEQDILGQPGAILFTAEDRITGVPNQEQRHAADSGRALDERWHLRKDGTRFWANSVMTAARDPRGTLRGFVKIMRDQTERKAIDARLHDALHSAQQLRVAAESANRAKDEFISTVSHELRTPLNTIRLWSQMFVSGKLHDRDLMIEGAKVIDRAAQAQQQLIDDLLDVSRMATGHLRLVLRDARLDKVIENAMDAVRPLAQIRQIILEADLSPEVGLVRIDPDRIQQVVWNLLSNAVKFTPEGGHAALRLRRVNEIVQIEVSDSGRGIRPEFLEHVFDRFRQAEAGAARRHGGLGLGLAIARQLVDLHGGTIKAHSDGEGRGATFTVRLPLERRFAATDEPDSAAALEDTDTLRGIEILLIEDESMTRNATALMLEQYGSQVRAVNSAARAGEAFEIRRPDVIVADVGMPDEDGYSLLRRLRSREQEQNWPRVPSVAVTAFARSEDRQLALAAGFDEHVPKPVNPERLVSVLAALVRNGKQRG